MKTTAADAISIAVASGAADMPTLDSVILALTRVVSAPSAASSRSPI